MTYVVTKFCDGCKYTDCVEACPVDAFHEGETMLYINPETCIDCDACMPACPVEAIYPDYDVPEKWAEYTELNEKMCRDLPVISEKKAPLPTAKTLEELEAAEG